MSHWNVCKLLRTQHFLRCMTDTAQSTITNLPAVQLLLLTAIPVANFVLSMYTLSQ